MKPQENYQKKRFKSYTSYRVHGTQVNESGKLFYK